MTGLQVESSSSLRRSILPSVVVGARLALGLAFLVVRTLQGLFYLSIGETSQIKVSRR